MDSAGAPMTPLRWASAFLLLLLTGFGVYSCRDRRIVQQQTQQADQNHLQGATHEAQAATQDQQVIQQTPATKAHDKEITALRAEIDRLKQSRPDDLAPIVAKQGTLIIIQDQKIGALEVQSASLASARDSWRSAATDYKAEAGNLRSVIAHIPDPRPLAAGVLYGTDKSMGAWVEYDLGPVRIGADLVRRPLDIAGRTTLEATARLGWRFK